MKDEFNLDEYKTIVFELGNKTFKFIGENIPKNTLFSDYDILIPVLTTLLANVGIQFTQKEERAQEGFIKMVTEILEESFSKNREG